MPDAASATRVVQGRAAAHYQVAAVGVRGGQPPPKLGLQEQAAAVEPPSPRLAVVQRGRVAAELDGGADGLAVDRVDDHGRHSCLVNLFPPQLAAASARSPCAGARCPRRSARRPRQNADGQHRPHEHHERGQGTKDRRHCGRDRVHDRTAVSAAAAGTRRYGALRVDHDDGAGSRTRRGPRLVEPISMPVCPV